jgi:hypothetical protein
MRLNAPRRLVKEDYPTKYNDLTDKLLDVLNDFMGEVYQGFNKRLNYQDNFEAFVTEITVIAGQEARIRNELPVPIRGSTVLRVDPLTVSNELLTSAPFIQFTNGNSQIIINNITGLTPGRSYRLRVVFYI